MYTTHWILYFTKSNFVAILYNNLTSNNLSHGNDAIHIEFLCISPNFWGNTDMFSISNTIGGLEFVKLFGVLQKNEHQGLNQSSKIGRIVF